MDEVLSYLERLLEKVYVSVHRAVIARLAHGAVGVKPRVVRLHYAAMILSYAVIVTSKVACKSWC